MQMKHVYYWSMFRHLWDANFLLDTLGTPLLIWKAYELLLQKQSDYFIFQVHFFY